MVETMWVVTTDSSMQTPCLSVIRDDRILGDTPIAITTKAPRQETHGRGHIVTRDGHVFPVRNS